ncbi:lipoyl synthase 1, chloroplastic isoform X1 [Punica granatum]|uniref:Lipoyl synthase, mitochondrial n=1 Tax=Punica granatum TaxID=22663 RepID=A0A6P8BV23_PUNGR|nr:lipoyl synthase 1, chloroplastic isoform X1 [Punica granatum]
MLHQSLSKPSISIQIPVRHPSSTSCTAFRVRCAESVDSQPKTSASGPPPPAAAKLMESEASAKRGPYPGGMTGPFTGRDPNVKKPAWLRQRAPQGQRYDEVKESLSRLNLNTVCEEAQCPNIGEIASGVFKIVMFCSIDVGRNSCSAGMGEETVLLLLPSCSLGILALVVAGFVQSKPAETPLHLIRWNLKIPQRQLQVGDYIVLTSVDRDDLPDGGSGHFAQTVEAMKKLKPEIMVECLTSDFRGDLTAVESLARSGLDVFAHNIETVKKLQRIVRDPRAGYEQSLSVLKHAKMSKEGMITKSSIMLGLGETDDELKEAMADLRAIDVDILTLGQYLQPTPLHLTVKEYVTPEKFSFWKEYGESIGFRYVASGPLVRSSYRAGELFVKTMVKDKAKASISSGTS